MFVVVVNFVIAAEHTAAFAEAVRAQASNSLNLEKDCHVFDVCIAGNEFLLYEKYSTSEAFDEHLRSEHFKQFDADVAPWVSSKTVSKWQEQGAAA